MAGASAASKFDRVPPGSANDTRVERRLSPPFFPEFMKQDPAAWYFLHTVFRCLPRICVCGDRSAEVSPRDRMPGRSTRTDGAQPCTLTLIGVLPTQPDLRQSATLPCGPIAVRSGGHPDLRG
jgi:hypothetical protein